MERELWISNEWVEAGGSEKAAIIDPATEAAVGSVPNATAPDVHSAVQAAKAAFAGWRNLDEDTRVDSLQQVSRRMLEAAPELAVTLTHETGRLLRRNQMYVEWSARLFDYYAQLARNDLGRIVPSAAPEAQLNLVLKVPYGVVGCIVPFNYPISLLAWKVAPALAAGNTVVIKPAPQTPLATLEMMPAAFDHLPPGVVNVVTGLAEVGETLVAHPDVPFVAFTGSTAVGQRIFERAASSMKRFHLELGGNDPAIICADANLEDVVRGISWGGFLNAGQVCTSVERVYVERPIYEEFVDRLAEHAGQLAVGSGFDPETEVTPLISARQRERVHALVQAAVSDGATLLCGGQVPSRKGFFYPPTVLADCTHEMGLMRQETFGPVVGVRPFDDFDEAIALANDSEYALGASLFTYDARRARRMFSEVAAGTIWVNDLLVENLAAPFGGMKMSGIGRELGAEGLDEFRQSKHVHWDVEGQRKPWWFE